MANYTDRLGLILQAYSSNPETWGTELNEAVFKLLDEMVGVEEIAVNADISLSWEDAVSNQARHLFIPFSGAGGHTVTVKGVDRFYLVHNKCAADITIKPENGTGAVVRAGTLVVWYTNGLAAQVGGDLPLNKLRAPDGALALNGQKITNLAAGTAPHEAVNRGQLDTIAGSTDAAIQAASSAQASLNAINQKITISTQPPVAGAGSDGDLWFLIS